MDPLAVEGVRLEFDSIQRAEMEAASSVSLLTLVERIKPPEPAAVSSAA